MWKGMYVICLKWCGVGCVEGDVCNLPGVVMGQGGCHTDGSVIAGVT